MGVTISCHKYSIDMGAGGYNRLRETVSTLLHCEEFAKIYAELSRAHQECYARGFANMHDYYEDHDNRVLAICEANQLDEEVVNWLYSSDCSYSATPKQCRHIWEVIKDYDDDYVYGYCGRPDAARFKDFKQIVLECAKERRRMRIS